MDTRLSEKRAELVSDLEYATKEFAQEPTSDSRRADLIAAADRLRDFEGKLEAFLGSF